MDQSSSKHPLPRNWSTAAKLSLLVFPFLALCAISLAWIIPDRPWVLWAGAVVCVLLTGVIFQGTRLVVTQPLRRLALEMERIAQSGGEISAGTDQAWARPSVGEEIRGLWQKFSGAYQRIWKEQKDRALELQREAAAHESLTRRLLELHQVAQMIHQAISEHDIYRTLAHTLYAVLPLRQVLILRLNPSEDRLQIVWTWPKRDDLSLDAYPVWDKPSSCPVIRSGREYLVQRVGRDLTCASSLSNSEGDGYWCVPLVIGGRTIGVVHLASSVPDCWTEQSRKWVEALINSAAPMIGHLQHLERAKRRAMIDELTGAYNRRFLEEFLAKMIVPEERRRNQQLSLLMIDLDHFKLVNDTYGHPVGDEVLKAVASTLHRNLKESDVLARYGGEEFTVILPRTDSTSAAIVAERLRSAIANLSFCKLAPSVPDRVTISIGVAAYPSHARTVSELIRCADEALYQAKSLGRNRVVCVCANSLATAGHQTQTVTPERN